jgi:outer membrane protein assembly factor BamB
MRATALFRGFSKILNPPCFWAVSLLSDFEVHLNHSSIMIMNCFKTSLRWWSSLTLLLFAAAGLQAENWPQWRGPHFNGSSSEKNLPTKFSKTENVKWVADLPGPAASTPVIYGDKVFVTSTDLRTYRLQAICLDRKTGEALWQHEVAEGLFRDDRSNFASPSPATDGERVIFFYGTGDLLAFDMEGKKLWQRNIQTDYGPFAFLWTFSSSPLLHDGRLYLQVLQRDVPVGGRGRSDGPNESYLLALDPKSGNELFRVVRPSEARAESLEAFSTPIPFEHNGRKEILIAGGDLISGHDPQTGRELWRWGTWNPERITHWRLVPSPVAGDGIILACAPKGDPVYAVKAGGKGELDDSWLAWVSEDRRVSSDVPTPLFYEGKFYILNKRPQFLNRVEPKTGKVLWTGDLETRSEFESSPTGADGKIYMMSHEGEVIVAAAGDEFKILHRVNMADENPGNLRQSDTLHRSTIAVSQGNLFIRTLGKLYCIGN